MKLEKLISGQTEITGANTIDFTELTSRPCEPWPLMPRKGWSTVEVPDGWLQVIRGPRPPAVRWPKAPRGRGQDRPQNLNKKGRKLLFQRFVEAHHKSLQLLRSELCVYRRQWSHWETTTVPRPRCCAMLSRRHNRMRPRPLSECDSTLVPNLSRERGTGCPEPTKRCGKHKTNESGWSRT